MSNNVKLNILVSYEYIDDNSRQTLIDNQDKLNIIIDSGAFTAHTKNKEINLNEYSSYIKNLKKEIVNFNAIQLDVVFNPEKTKENFIKQMEAGVEVCPVFTRGDDPQYFFKLLREGYYVFVGGVQKGENNKGFAKYLLERSKGEKVHYLAFTNQRFIRAYSPYSVDSSSWTRASRFGYFEAYAGFGKLVKIEKLDFVKPLSESKKILLNKLGLNEVQCKALGMKESWVSNGKLHQCSLSNIKPQNSLGAYLSMLGHIQQAVDLEKKFKTKTYFASGSRQSILGLIHGWNELKERNLI